MFKYLPLEIIHSMLYNVTYSDIINFCRAYPKFSDIYNDDIFWKTKLDRDIHSTTGTVSEYVTLYGKEEAWVEIYKRWELNKHINLMQDTEHNLEHNVDIIIWRLDQNTLFGKIYNKILKQLYMIGIQHSNLNILNKLIVMGIKLNVDDNVHIMRRAVEFAGVHIIHWLSDMYSSDMANIAAEFGRIDILNLLKDEGIYPDPYNNQTYNRKVSVFDWLESIDKPQTPFSADIALLSNKIDILNWLKARNIYPTQAAINTVLTYSHDKHELLDWLASNNLYPSSTAITTYINQSNLFILTWLAQNRILLGQDHITHIIKSNMLNILDWLETLGQNQTSWSADIALRYSSIDVLHWLAKRSIYPTQASINNAVLGSGSTGSVLDYLKQYKLAPDQTTIQTSIQNNMPSKDWLLQSGYLNQDTIIHAALYSSWFVLEWLNTKKIYPDARTMYTIAQYGRTDVLHWYALRGIR